MKKLVCIFLGAVCILLLIFSPLLVKGESKEEKPKTTILTVWHIDGFEGGKGSRYTFLREVATEFSKKNKGVYTLVSSYTMQGANELLINGKTPDLISYGGVGLNLQNLAKEINFSGIDGGTVGNKRYAVSYLKGGYFAIKKGDGKDKVIISKGENISTEIATLFSGVKGEKYLIFSPLDAYATFLTSKSATLIGTQRDIERLLSRGESFTAQPIKDYNDLYQYLSLTTKKPENEYLAKKFFEYVLSESVQKKVVNLKMLSVNQTGLYSDNEYLSNLEKTKMKYTFSPFSAKQNLSLACSEALKALKNDKDYNEIIKYVKQL